MVLQAWDGSLIRRSRGRPAMRAWPLLALLVVVAVPVGAAQETFLLPAGSLRSFEVEAGHASRYEIGLEADVAVDVVLVRGSLTDTNQTPALAFLNRTNLDATGDFPEPGTWSIVIDNSPAFEGGANGSQNASVRVHWLVQSPPTPPPPPGDVGVTNPWPVLMLTAPFWDVAFLGLGGMALWFLLLGTLAAVRYRAGWDKIAVLAIGSGLLLVGWTFLPREGPVADIFLPLFIAAGVAWLATRGTPDGLQAARMAFIAGGLGALLGGTVAHLLRLLWSSPGSLVLGAGRFDDPVFLLPVAAGGGALLVAVVKALVEASEDDEEAATEPSGTGLTATFTVTCVRCATPMTVDRSMRRFRVATDRYEFACPNCHAWMEWAEPKATA